MTEGYPDGYEAAWLATDQEGHIGVFITAGRGPIPSSAANIQVLNLEVEDLILRETAKASEVMLLESHPDMSSDYNLASRGLFVFDWSDIHRTAIKKTFKYELVAAPVTPVLAQNLPDEITELANATKFSKWSFASKNPISVHEFFDCIWPTARQSTDSKLKE